MTETVETGKPSAKAGMDKTKSPVPKQKSSTPPPGMRKRKPLTKGLDGPPTC